MELNPNIRKILEGRGITSEKDIEEYLSDKPKISYDPFLLHDMEAGVDLILSAIDKGENICIYGDYDTDGVTSVTLLKDVLGELGCDASFYIPSRMDEGYGLNEQALDKIKKAGADLVITVDCGCTSVEEVEHSKKIGLDILITDHHEMKSEIPNCLLINPKHPDSEYPFRNLAGVGVAFKLAQALVDAAGLSKDVLTRNLDLVSMGTIGDMVPLIDENRMLTKYGLRAINISERPGLKALIEKTGLRLGEIRSGNVAFVISPHINAAGRMENATLAARLMQTKDKDKARSLAEELSRCNQNRKEIQQSLVDRCADAAEKQIEEGDKCIFVELEDAHEGVIGIVASQVKEKYGMPTLILTTSEEGQKKGSGRSPDGIDILSVINKFPHIFSKFGGHSAACGFTLKDGMTKEFRDSVNTEFRKLYTENPESYSVKKNPEIILEGNDVGFDFIDEQKKMEPFGKDNPKPLIGVRLSQANWERMGMDGKYLRMSGKLSNGEYLRCVDFKKGDYSEEMLKKAQDEGRDVLAIGTLDERVWNDKKYIQMELEHIE